MLLSDNNQLNSNSTKLHYIKPLNSLNSFCAGLPEDIPVWEGLCSTGVSIPAKVRRLREKHKLFSDAVKKIHNKTSLRSSVAGVY